jgi:threonine dehydrogenase-like Zn-dependent dehydrogenase
MAIMAAMMKAAVFVEKAASNWSTSRSPTSGPNDALIRITTTTICGTDVHILKGEYPVAKGLTVGHEPVGVIEKLGSAVQGYTEGQRVIAGAICPNFNSYAAQDGAPSQDGSYLIPQGLCGCHGFKATAGWRFGNLIDGTQAEYVLVPDAQANLAPHSRRPDRRAGADVPRHHVHRLQGRGERQHPHRRHRGGVRPGPDRPVRHRGRALLGATTIIAVDGNDHRLGIAQEDGRRPHAQLQELRCGRRDHEAHRRARRRRAIEALGTQATFESALRVLKPGGTLSSLGVYSSDLTIPLSPSPPAWATTASSPPCARAARSACAG